MGIARIIGAVSFSIIIGIMMSLIYRKEEKAKRKKQMNIVPPPEKRPMWQTSLHIFHTGTHPCFRQLGQAC
jgi:uncharacterized membrane protein YraQ (UPF0718 family)